MTPISNRDKRTYSLQINDRFFSNFITETVDIRVSGEKVWSNFWGWNTSYIWGSGIEWQHRRLVVNSEAGLFLANKSYEGFIDRDWNTSQEKPLMELTRSYHLGLIVW